MDTGFVYRWINEKTKKFYIGSHKGKTSDNYIGGGVYFKRAFNKSPKLFSRDILYQGIFYREFEEYILNKLNAVENPLMYNLKNAAIGGKTILSDEGRKKLSDKMKGTKNPNFGKPTWNKGKKRKPHVIEAIKKAQNGRIHKREDVIKRCKHLVKIEDSKLMTIKEAATFLGYKDCTTLRDHLNNKRISNKLKNIKIEKLCVI